MKYAPSTDPSQLQKPGRPPKILEGHGKIRQGLRQLYRDMDSILWAYRGKSPAPFLVKDGSAYNNRKAQNASNLLNERTFKVLRVEPTAEDAVKITLGPLDGETIAFRPGQFLTLAIEMDGQVLKRPYSICSTASETESISIGVRQIEGGRVSTYLNQSLKPGDQIGAYGPSGDYGIQPEQAPEDIVCIAGGSGITPHLSILRHTLEQSETSTATLLFVNRTKQSAMFTKELKSLQNDFGTRFNQHNFFSRSKQKLSTQKLKSLLKAEKTEADFFLCGPQSLMDLAAESLKAMGVAASSIHREEFSAAASTTHKATSDRTESLTIHTADGHTTTTIEPGQTILEAGLKSGSQLPYSCTMGGCGACKIKVVSGEVSMPEPNCLTSDEKASGHVLSCIAHACGPITIEADS